MMNFALLIVLSVTMRLFLFEIKLNPLRQWLMEKHRLFDIFLNCPFCNGFWTGLVTFLIFNWEYATTSTDFYDLLGKLVVLVYFSVAVGAISYLIYNFFEKLEKDDSFEA